MQFTHKIIKPTKRVGTKLRELREEKEVALDYLSKKIRIGKDILTALEESRFDDMPFTGIYQKNIVRSYAEFLEIDPAPFVKQFEKEELLKNKKHGHQKQYKNTQQIHFNIPAIAKIIGLLALAGILIFYFTSQIQRITTPPNLHVYNPKDGQITYTPVIKVQGKTDEKTAIQINGKEIPHSEKGLFEADITLSQGINALTFTATKRHGKNTSETRHVIYIKQK